MEYKLNTWYYSKQVYSNSFCENLYYFTSQDIINANHIYSGKHIIKLENFDGTYYKFSVDSNDDVFLENLKKETLIECSNHEEVFKTFIDKINGRVLESNKSV